MKIIFPACVVVACSFSVNAMDVSQAREAVAHAERNYSAAEGSYKNEAHWSGSGVVGSAAEAQMNSAAAARAQAYADLRSAEQQAQAPSLSAKTPVTGSMAAITPGVKTHPAETINVAAATLAPSAKVQTAQGIVSAGSLPADTQVAVAFNSAFHTPVKGGSAQARDGGHAEHGTGNGANNAASSRSAHGLGGGEHVGGGRSGGGFHY
ncbi:hypothetical protein [Shimwellia blattae]|uniref:Putative membrane protein n=1 Tax=Shimwellia blattae (strain ATCC 29907 / DSM 4481 / JCM 1650 / NBRC 105725 / CDC 9005-74) TaxID=630626 RepID=I2B7C4_SHIBC|nr:hypothetical protein [Shimwellia blattae]AFJ46428.1 putative membrane protein [Shimwellia blattae DSM 4481 = NBRC 105725]VDY63895.1 Uncharacterised protein [Shimwellia blattae]VEC22032.1 Uncharacterised protein [Shimwellia blattae]